MSGTRAGEGLSLAPGKPLLCSPEQEKLPWHGAARCLQLYPVYFLFQIPEVLLWAKEQNEEKSPNLTQFTEHFNNMSYW